MTMQTLSLCNTHPPLIPSTNPLKTSTISTFKTHYQTPNKAHKCYRRLTVFAIKEEEEQSTPSWAKPDSNEPPPWARNEAQQESSSSSADLPFGVYLLASAITAIAAIGSVFEYVNQKPVFGVLESDSIFYAPVLGFFAITGLPTAVSLCFFY
ncbi:hypothetical protein Tco_0679727 [Tanacetum coccineum]|uniref:Uncharacterized protein n=1 Tax=Tanacetum coccineum TaxID=301880 RepID=A0ABQ4XJN7_9ASTR